MKSKTVLVDLIVTRKDNKQEHSCMEVPASELTIANLRLFIDYAVSSWVKISLCIITPKMTAARFEKNFPELAKCNGKIFRDDPMPKGGTYPNWEMFPIRD